MIFWYVIFSLKCSVRKDRILTTEYKVYLRKLLTFVPLQTAPSNVPISSTAAGYFLIRDMSIAMYLLLCPP